MSIRHLLLTLVLTFGLAHAAPAAPLPAKDRLVILITVDGLPAWIWKNPGLVMPHVR